MKKLFAICSSFIFLFFGFLTVNNVLGQETPEELAEKYDITFPINELGSCENYSECRTYCEDPVNQNKCIEFAKKKGFYKEEEFRESQSFLSRARQVLGCTSFDSCRAFCEKEENFDRCHQFAQSTGVAGGYSQDPRSEEFLAKAKENLGCDSYQSCQNFCENTANRDRCSNFARSIGAHGGYESSGPGGCSSEETCKAFCGDPNNYQICSRYGGGERGYKGPGGCDSEESCRAYCEKNPQECGHYSSGAAPGGMTTEEYCKAYPDRCGGFSDPASYCSKTPGCSWTGSSCQCTSTTGQYTPYPASGGSYDPATECTKTSGCSWTGSSCQCSGSSGGGTYDPASECTKQSGCSWTGSSCQCQGSGEESTPQPQAETSPQPSPVQGLATEGFLQGFVNFLISLLGQ